MPLLLSIVGLVLSGGLMALAQPPVFFFPILYVALPAAILIILRTRYSFRKTFLLGTLFGFVFFTASLHWVSQSILIGAPGLGWFGAGFLVLLGSFYQSLYSGLSFVLARFAKTFPGRVFYFVIFWSLCEWLRSVIPWAFPWSFIGHSWLVSTFMSQLNAWIGAHGVSLLAVLSACLPALLIMRKRQKWIVGMAVAIPVLAFFIGSVRLTYLRDEGGDTAYTVRLVQPNIPQREKWRPENRQAHLDTLFRLTSQESESSASLDLVVWPEAATPFRLAQYPEVLEAIGQLLGPDTKLITGSIHREDTHQATYNSMFLIHRGELISRYDKANLVPFGEYVPFDGLWGLGGLVEGAGNFAAGSGVRTWTNRAVLGELRISPLVCYDIIFSSRIHHRTIRPNLLVNVTNDAWFGRFWGPYQHFELARLRSIEYGLPLVRVANTGISAVVDGKGRIVGQLDLETQGVLDAPIPGYLGRTLYDLFGEFIFFISMLVIFVVVRFKEKSFLTKSKKPGLTIQLPIR